MPLIVRYGPSDLPWSQGIGVNMSVLMFALAVVALATLVFGVLPALVGSRESGAAMLRSREASGAPGTGLHRRVLVVTEIALSMALLVGSGLMLRTLVALRQQDPGFEASRALSFRISLWGLDPAGPGQRAEFLRHLSDRLAALPGVEAVGAVGGLPLSGERWARPYGQVGEPPAAWAGNEADLRVVTSDYDAMGIRRLAGRSFTLDEDLAENRRVVIVDATMAQRLAPDGASVLGRMIALPFEGRPAAAEIVGVVEPVRYERIEQAGREAIYVPYRQEASRDVSVVLRVSSGSAEALTDAVRRELAALDARVPAYDFRPLGEYVRSALAPTRFALTLLAGRAAMAVALGCTGLYGILAFTVSQRTREFGIRLAVGAEQRRVLREVLTDGAALIATRLVFGSAVSLAFARALSDLLFGVRPADPLTFVAVCILLTICALTASYIPARRAASVDPVQALRYE